MKARTWGITAIVILSVLAYCAVAFSGQAPEGDIANSELHPLGVCPCCDLCEDAQPCDCTEELEACELTIGGWRHCSEECKQDLDDCQHALNLNVLAPEEVFITEYQKQPLVRPWSAQAVASGDNYFGVQGRWNMFGIRIGTLEVQKRMNEYISVEATTDEKVWIPNGGKYGGGHWDVIEGHDAYTYNNSWSEDDERYSADLLLYIPEIINGGRKCTLLNGWDVPASCRLSGYVGVGTIEGRDDVEATAGAEYTFRNGLAVGAGAHTETGAVFHIGIGGQRVHY